MLKARDFLHVTERACLLRIILSNGTTHIERVVKK